MFAKLFYLFKNLLRKKIYFFPIKYAPQKFVNFWGAYQRLNRLFVINRLRPARVFRPLRNVPYNFRLRLLENPFLSKPKPFGWGQVRVETLFYNDLSSIYSSILLLSLLLQFLLPQFLLPQFEVLFFAWFLF